MSIVITSGIKYADIDTWASLITLKILLNSLGIPALAVCNVPLNESIPSIITDLNYHLDDYTPTNNDQFILTDVSNPNFFPAFVKHDQIIEIIDHHTGFEQYWENNTKAQIEFIGSVCTIIFERFIAYKKEELLDPNLCKLLTAAILDNTLNLKASVTTERDIEAYRQLMRIGHLDDNWANEYFMACEKEILIDLEKSLRNDIKINQNIPLLPNVFGQLVILSVEPIMSQLDLIKKLFRSNGSEWMLNLICLSDGKSYIIADNTITKNDLEKLFNISFDADILTLDHFMLRKEIMKKAEEKNFLI
jgi:inorganic pyrophosphatase/manganese-dependent inorganic pyrophosphatase